MLKDIKRSVMHLFMSLLRKLALWFAGFESCCQEMLESWTGFEPRAGSCSQVWRSEFCLVRSDPVGVILVLE